MQRVEEERDRVCRQGTEAWKRLKKEKSWGDWLKVGEALQIGREWAMNQAGISMHNRPEGKAYNMAFGEWMQRYKLDDMDKGDRSRLFGVMDNLPMIEQWRQTLTQTERLRLNHPNSVLRKWKSAMEPEKPKDPNAKPTLRDSVVTLSEDKAALESRVAELEARLQEAEATRESSTAAPDELIGKLAELLKPMSREEQINKIDALRKSVGLSTRVWMTTIALPKKSRRKYLAAEHPDEAQPAAEEVTPDVDR